MPGVTLEKHLNLLDFALASLWRRRAKNGGVFLVFAAVIFLLASFMMVTEALTREAATTLRQAPDITLQRMVAGRQESIPLAYADRLQSLFGIRSIAPRIWGYHFDASNGANYTILGLDPRSMPLGEQLAAALSDGHLPGPEEKGAVVVGQGAWQALHLNERDIFSLFRPDLTLKAFRSFGRFSQATDLLTHDLIVMGLDDARDLFALPATEVTDLCIYVTNPAEVDTLARKISGLLPDTRVLTRNQILKTYQVVFGWRSGFASVCLLASLAAFAILAWDKASGLSPEERREIGLLKFLGWETADILAIRFWEGLLVSLGAFVLGTTMAYIHVAYFEASLFRPVLVGWSMLRPSFLLVPEISFAQLFLIFCLAVLPYLAVTVVPAWRTAIVPADSALRGT